MRLTNSRGIKAPIWRPGELLRSDDISSVSFTKYQLVTDLFALIADEHENIARVISGLQVLPNNNLTLDITAGSAVSFEGYYEEVGDSGFDFVSDSGYPFSVVLEQDEQVAVESRDLAPRIDIVELRPKRVTYLPGTRRFRDPLTGTVSSSVIDTMVSYEVEIQVKKGDYYTAEGDVTPAPHAPDKTPGWIKVVEIFVDDEYTDQTDITEDNITSYYYSSQWENDQGVTGPVQDRAITILVDDGAGRFSSSEVENALTEIPTFNELSSNANGDGASLVGVEDSLGLYSVSDVESAIEESRTVSKQSSYVYNVNTGAHYLTEMRFTHEFAGKTWRFYHPDDIFEGSSSGGNDLSAVTISPDDTRIYMGIYGETIDTARIDSIEISVNGASLYTSSTGFDSSVRGLAVSSDNTYVYCITHGSSTDSAIISQVKRLQSSDLSVDWSVKPTSFGDNDSGRDLAISPDDSTIYIGGTTVEAMNASDGSQLWSVSVPTDVLVISPDGNSLYSGDAGGKLEKLSSSDGSSVWSISTTNESTTVGVNTIAVSPDGTTVYVGTDYDYVIAYDASNGSEIWTSEQFASNPQTITAKIDNEVLYVGVNSRTHQLNASDGTINWTFGYDSLDDGTLLRSGTPESIEVASSLDRVFHVSTSIESPETDERPSIYELGLKGEILYSKSAV